MALRSLQSSSNGLTPLLETDFDIEVVEAHHNQKQDAPSGTAKMLLEAIDPTHQYGPCPSAGTDSSASAAGEIRHPLHPRAAPWPESTACSIWAMRRSSA